MLNYPFCKLLRRKTLPMYYENFFILHLLIFLMGFFVYGRFQFGVFLKKYFDSGWTLAIAGLLLYIFIIILYKKYLTPQHTETCTLKDYEITTGISWIHDFTTRFIQKAELLRRSPWLTPEEKDRRKNVFLIRLVCETPQGQTMMPWCTFAFANQETAQAFIEHVRQNGVVLHLMRFGRIWRIDYEQNIIDSMLPINPDYPKGNYWQTVNWY